MLKKIHLCQQQWPQSVVSCQIIALPLGEVSLCQGSQRFCSRSRSPLNVKTAIPPGDLKWRWLLPFRDIKSNGWVIFPGVTMTLTLQSRVDDSHQALKAGSSRALVEQAQALSWLPSFPSLCCKLFFSKTIAGPPVITEQSLVLTPPQGRLLPGHSVIWSPGKLSKYLKFQGVQWISDNNFPLFITLSFLVYLYCSMVRISPLEGNLYLKPNSLEERYNNKITSHIYLSFHSLQRVLTHIFVYTPN